MNPARAAEWMDVALELARRGRGTTRPNPMVGAVIVRDGAVIGEGFHRRAGGPHAEVHALRAAGDPARGADMIVTLEPCCHVGRTPACTEAIIEAGIARVWVGCEDPNPRVAGQGIAALEAAGIAVISGLQSESCTSLNGGYNHWMRTERPRVILKLATSLDGKIATATGASQWITGRASRVAVHGLRSEVDAIMVGSGTALADDPALTVRDVPFDGDPPTRVVVDSRLRVGDDARFFADDGAQIVVVTSDGAPAERIASLRSRGATVLALPAPDGHLALPDVIATLGRLEPSPVRSLLVEGGSGLATALLQNDLVDEMRLFMAPMWIGSDGLGALGALGITHPDAAHRFAIHAVNRHGADVELHLLREGERSCSPV